MTRSLLIFLAMFLLATALKAQPVQAQNPSVPSGNGMVGTPPYAGPHADVARYLLEHVSGWKIFTDASKDVPPTLPGSLPCQRDAYIYAATQAAWAANAHVAVHMEAAAGPNIDLMMHSLEQAKQLCSNAPVVSGGQACQSEWMSCATLTRYLSE